MRKHPFGITPRLALTGLLGLLLAPGYARANEFDGRRSLSNDERAELEADKDEAHKAIEEKYKGDNSREARRAKARELQSVRTAGLQQRRGQDGQGALLVCRDAVGASKRRPQF